MNRLGRLHNRRLNEAVKTFRAAVQLSKDDAAALTNLAAVLILQLVQATLAAAVAQRFPFRRTHLGERLAPPEREFFAHRGHTRSMR